MSKFFKIVFSVLLMWSVYHLIRDIATDLLGLHHPLVDFGHRQYPGVYWCTPYCQYVTFPVEIFTIIASAIVLKRQKVGWLGVVVLLSLAWWLYSFFIEGVGPLFPR